MLRVWTQCYSDGTDVSMLVEDMSRNKPFFFHRFEYHIFHNLYLIVTYLRTLPHIWVCFEWIGLFEFVERRRQSSPNVVQTHLKMRMELHAGRPGCWKIPN
jgi:hypothetical protein